MSTKIYNEIVLQWNDETQQFDTLYEDSFDYEGPLALLHGDDGDGHQHGGCGDPSDGTWSFCLSQECTEANMQPIGGTRCCYHSQFLGLEDADGNNISLRQPSMAGTCSPNESMIYLTTTNAVDYHDGSAFCCLSNDVARAEITTPPGGVGAGYAGQLPFCTDGNCGKQMNQPCGGMSQMECSISTDGWELEWLDLGPNYWENTGNTNDWLCSPSVTDFYTCNNRDINNIAGPPNLMCDCPNGSEPNQPCYEGSDSTYCNSETPTQGEYSCPVNDDCGVCGGDGIPDGFCNCNGGVLDPCGVCAGDAQYPVEDYQNDYPEPFIRYKWTGNDLHYCDCGTDGTAGTATRPQTQTCFISDSFDELGVEFEFCENNIVENCNNLDGYTSSTEALDHGCMDPTACNYHSGFDIGCNDTEMPGDNSYGDTSCCIYPVKFCKIDGVIYGTNQGDFANNSLCDVDEFGQPITITHCPPCPDGEGCPNIVPPNNPDALAVSYYDYHDMQANGITEIIPNQLYVNGGDYIYAGASWIEEVPADMLDTSIPGVTLYGCDDPAALNYGGTSLHSDPSSVPGDNCEYCPTTSAECPGGYTFYWGAELTPDISTAAWVTSGMMTSGQFHIMGANGEASTVITNNNIGGGEYNSGACFCNDDLQFLSDLASNINGYENDPLFITQQIGSSSWNSFGKLKIFMNDSGVCNSSEENCRLNSIGLTGNIPTSIQNLTYLEYLDLSYGYMSGNIPSQIGSLVNLIYLDLSYNDFNGLLQTDHYVDAGQIPVGMCVLVERNGTPTISNEWLKLKGNKICPTVESQFNNTTSYPICLAPRVGSFEWDEMTDDHQEWVYRQLGFIDLPNFVLYSGYNTSDPSQYIAMGDDIDPAVCTLTGCLDPTAKNYWPEATNDCGESCCVYDNFLHFPWGTPDEGDGSGFPEGCYGCGMTKEEMVQALHADILGFQYNSFGDLDVTGYPTSYTGQCDGSNDVFLPMNVINNCSIGFSNNPNVGGGSVGDYIDGNGIISHWDGIWIRDNGYTGEQNLDNTIYGGDARPLEFINRIEYEASLTNNPNEFKSLWFFQFFPQEGLDISMYGINYIDDYDLDGNQQITGNDADIWENVLGRIDIANQINYNLWDEFWPYPEEAPEDVELWEQAAVSISMSYSQTFITEEDVGFTLYPEENSPGVLSRTGQWQCDDGGDSSVCYEDFYACGRAPYWMQECTPCGNGGGICIPLTTMTAAEGHEKISKTKLTGINYFSNGNSPTIAGADIYTASLSSSNHPYYFSLTDGDPKSSKSDTQFNVSWGHYAGSGSDTGENTYKGTSEAIYKQYASLLLDDKQIDDGFLISSGSDVRSDGQNGNRDDWIYILNFKRKRFEDQLQNGTWTLVLSGSTTGNNGSTISLTDDSITDTSPPLITDAGRRYNIISGSAGVPHTGYNPIGGRYGFIYPDAGVIVLGEKLSHEFRHTASPEIGIFNSSNSGSHQFYPYTGSEDGKNALRLVNGLRNVNGNAFTLYGEKEVTEVVYVCRLDGDNFNFTSNFSIISSSGRQMYSTDTGVMGSYPTSTHESRCFTGSVGQPSSICSGSEPIETTSVNDFSESFVWPGSDVVTMHGNSTTFITGVQLYDEHGEMLAIATLSKPLRKSFDREAVIKVKLTY